MPFIEPEKITVLPGRFRKDFSSVEQRAREIKQLGQFDPILVKEENNQLVLIDGETRLRACILLKRKVWYTTNTEGRLEVPDEYQHKLLELMANTARADMTVLEKSQATSELDRLLKEIHGQSGQAYILKEGQEGWDQEKTANLMGYRSAKTIERAKVIARAAETMPELAEAKTASEAMRMIQVKVRLEAQEELATRRAAEPQKGPISDPEAFFSKRVITGECPEIVEAAPSNSVSIVLTDIPYAIDYKTEDLKDGKFTKKNLSKKVTGLYNDLPEEILPAVIGVIAELPRVCRPNAFIFMFCAYRYWSFFSSIYQKAGFEVYNKPITWVRGNLASGSLEPGSCNCPWKWPASNTDCILFARRGNAVLARQGRPDVIVCNTPSSSEKIHSLQRPVQLLSELISWVFHENTKGILMDPFCGSGSSLAATLHFSGLDFFGYEKNPEFRQRAVSYLVNYYYELHNPKPAAEIDLDLEV